MFTTVKTCPALSGWFLPLSAGIIGLGISVSPAQPVNDLFAYRTPIFGTNVAVTASSLGATKEPGEPLHSGNFGGASVWWSWKAPANGWATISTAGSSFDTVLGIYTATTMAALEVVESNDDEDFDNAIYTSKVVFQVTLDQTYQIAVDGYSGESGTVKLAVKYGPPEPSPPWVMPDPYGVMIHSTNFFGKVMILDYWATWCAPCRAGMPDLVALQEKYRADGLVVVGADTGWSGDTPAVVQDFLRTFAPTINYQVVMASPAMMQDFGDISAIPTTFIIDRDNLIRKKYVGTQTGATLEKQIIPMLYNNTRLTSRLNGNQLVFSWPVLAQTFTLESAASPTASAWTAWPTTPINLNGTNSVSVPANGAPRYFRLHLSY
jgi:thiol-disulfide isomerase/thioredoxin